MLRRLNYTGRKKISRSLVTVRLRPAADGVYAFDARFDLSALDFPESARVFVEAYNATSYMRFPFGTVVRPAVPDDSTLTEITPRPLPKFRLKVVDQTNNHGLLLGVADKLVPLRPEEDPANKQSLLAVNFCDLGDRIWNLDLTDDWPVLELNNRVEGLGEVARSGESFLALVFPEIVRKILREIVLEQKVTDPDFDDADWMALWLRYVCALRGVGNPPDGDSDAAADWIEDAVQAFCRERDVRRRFQQAIRREQA